MEYSLAGSSNLAMLVDDPEVTTPAKTKLSKYVTVLNTVQGLN